MIYCSKRLTFGERITWPNIEFMTEVVEDVVEDDDGDLGDVAVFEFGEGGT